VSERIRLIDALRGLSLAAIAMAYVGEQYLGFMPPPRARDLQPVAEGRRLPVAAAL
jgi:hypothetical protein